MATRTHNTLKIASVYGTVDVRDGVPKGYVHVSGERLQPLCRKLKIKFAEALVGFKSSRRFGYSPVLDGVIVSSRSAAKLRTEIAARDARSASRKKPTPEQRAAARERREQRDVEKFAARIREQFPSIPPGEDIQIAEHACEIGSGRVGRSTVADDPVMAAVIAHVRHCHTDYDDLLDEACEHAFDREERESLRWAIRDQVREQILSIIEQWEQPVEECQSTTEVSRSSVNTTEAVDSGDQPP